MSTHGGQAMLAKMLSAVAPSERKLVCYILEYPKEPIAMTATELGKNSTTSGAAVIRLCKSLNLKGFQELKIRIAGDLQKTTEHGYRDIKPNESVASITEKMTSNSIQTIRETAD